jgi:glycogen(starch) synthase
MEQFWPSIGGAQIFGARLMVALRERGYEFLVVTRQDDPESPPEDRYAGIPVRRFPFLTMLTVGSAPGVARGRWEVAALKRVFAADLVHLYLVGPSSFFHLDTAHVHPSPLLVTLNGVLPDQAAGPDTLLGQTLRAADWVTCCSSAVVDQTRRQAPEVAPRSSLVYYGWKVPPLPPTPLPVTAPRVLCLGRLVRQKGFDLALSAVAALAPRFPSAVVVTGGGRHAPPWSSRRRPRGSPEPSTFSDGSTRIGSRR